MRGFSKERPRIVTLAVVLAPLATWAACVGPSTQATRPAGGSPIPRAAPVASAPGPDYEEGLVDLSAIGLAPSPSSEPGPPAPPLPDVSARRAGAEALARGLTLAAGRNPTAAAREFADAAFFAPQLKDWSEVLTARAYASVGDTAQVRRHVEPVLESRVGEWAWRPYYDALRASRDTERALGVARRAAERASTAAERAYAHARVGELLAANRDPGAIDAFRQAMHESPATPGGLAAARGAHDLPSLSLADHLLIGRTLLAHGGSERGIPLLEAYAAAPTTGAAERAEVRLELGRLHFNARRYGPATEDLRLAADAMPEAAFLLGRSLYRQGRQDEGTRTFVDVGRRFATSPFSADALFLLGDLAHDDGRASAAAEYYRQAVGTGVHTVSAADAVVRLAGIGLLANAPAAALRDLEGYFSTRPRDRTSAPALYWLGRARLDLGENDLALRTFQEVLDLDPFSYYGMLAARRLGLELTDVRLPDPPVAQLSTEVSSRLFVIDVLREAGLAEESDLELARLRDEVGAGSPALYEVAEAMARAGQPVAAALLAREIQRARDVWDDRLLRIVYLFPYREIVVHEARRHGLDPFAIAGLIRQESFFNPIAVSAAGAIGLMQVMPETGAGLARRVGINGFQSSRLRDPETNVQLGTLFLADQMRRWDGRFSDVLGSYNAGPNRVVRWRAFPEHRDDEIYVERIPIAETRDYVKRVSLNAEIYRRLYSGEL